MNINNAVSELKSIRYEVVAGIFVKIISVFLSILLIPKIASGENYYLVLTYTIGLVNMSKIFDGALPYLQRICYAQGSVLTLKSEINYSIFVYLIHFLIFFIITSDYLISISLTIFGKLYAIANFRLNISKRSYFFYLQHAFPLGICLFLKDLIGIYPDYVYIFVSYAILIIGLASNRFQVVKEIKTKPLADLWTPNISMNLLTMLVFFCYAEFAAVFLYGNIPLADYAIINSVTKVVLVLIGAASVISTPLWNYGNRNIGTLDKLSFTPILYLPFFSFSILGYFISTHNSDLQIFSIIDIKTLFLILIIGSGSVANLFISQILARLELSKHLLFLSIFELSVMVGILLAYSNTHNYFMVWMILIIFKYLTGIFILRVKDA
ncbi:MAG: hypothetical protein ACJ0F7_03705 [Gammaproteobacteria bacterium]